jgi:hypothetical protein
VVPPGLSARVDGFGNIVIAIAISAEIAEMASAGEGVSA